MEEVIRIVAAMEASPCGWKPLYLEDSTKRLTDNTLVALLLMIAESRTEEKDVMVKVVVSFKKGSPSTFLTAQHRNFAKSL